MACTKPYKNHVGDDAAYEGVNTFAAVTDKRTTHGHTRNPLRECWGGPTCPRISTWSGNMPSSSCVSRRAAARKVLSTYTRRMWFQVSQGDPSQNRQIDRAARKLFGPLEVNTYRINSSSGEATNTCTHQMGTYGEQRLLAILTGQPAPDFTRMCS